MRPGRADRCTSRRRWRLRISAGGTTLASEMELPGATLVFSPPAWPTVLLVMAAAAIAWELASLVRSILGQWRGGPAAAIALGVLAVGPIVAFAAAVFGVMAPEKRFALRTIVVAAIRGTLLALGTAVMVLWRPNGAPAGAIIALIGCAIAWAFRAYGRTTNPIKRPWKALLLCLRVAALLLLAVALLRPTLAYEHEEKLRRTVLLGVDTSASMQRRDMPHDYTLPAPAEGVEPVRRIDAVRQALRHNAPALRKLLGRANLSVFAFSTSAGDVAELTELPSRSPLTLELPAPAGSATAIGDAVAQAYDKHARTGHDIAAIVVISDGCNNTTTKRTPAELAEAMGAVGMSVHTVCVGSVKVIGSTQSLSIKELIAPEEVQAFNQLPISASISAIGLQDRNVKVTCTFGDKVVGTTDFLLSGPQVTHNVQFTHVPTAVGSHRLKIEAEVLGEQPKNLGGRPIATKLVRVFDTGLRILYVEGKFRFESKYIARALSAGRRFRVDRRVLLQPLREDQPPPLSDKMEDWLSYHAIIFGDVGASRFTRKQLEIIKELVGKRGKGFCMIGGRRSFGRGGWANTPIADVLPVVLQDATGEIRGNVKATPTRAGLSEPLMRISPDDKDVAAAWEKLPEMPGANRFGRLKPGARTLATDKATATPLIVAQRYGSGRTLAIAFDTTWRWVLTPKPTGQMQKRFWRQVGLYLAAPKGNVWIATDTTSYDLRRLRSGAQEIHVTGGVEDPSGRPILNAPLEVTLHRGENPLRKITLKVKDDQFETLLAPPSRPGVYVLKISADVAGEKLQAEHRFEVVMRDLESLDVLANPSLLRNISSASKGRHVPLAGIAGILRELTEEARPRTRVRLVYQDLSVQLRWPIVVAFIALLCVEWSLRKRKGLI